jgi:hypothetical protein
MDQFRVVRCCDSPSVLEIWKVRLHQDGTPDPQYCYGDQVSAETIEGLEARLEELKTALSLPIIDAADCCYQESA